MVNLVLIEQNFDLDLSELNLLIHYTVNVIDDDTPAEIKIQHATLSPPSSLHTDAFARKLVKMLTQHTDLIDQISTYADAKRPPIARHYNGYMTIDEFLDDPRREEVSR